MGVGAHGSVTGHSGTHRAGHHTRPPFSATISWGARGLAIALAGLMLAACAFDPMTIERTPRDNPGAETSAKSRLAARRGGPTTPSATTGKDGDKADIPTGDNAAPEVDLTNFKERLIGLDSDEIGDLMGTPGLERAEPPALIWQYRHQLCTVDIFMFDDGGGATVDHVEVRPTQGPTVDEKACFTALLRNAPAPAKTANQASAPPPAKPGTPPISPSPSTSVGRRAVPSAAPPTGGPAATPSSARSSVPVPSTAAPSAAPAAPARASQPPAAAGDMDEMSPEDTDVDFDMGQSPSTAPGAPPSLPPAAAPAAPPVSRLPPRSDATPPTAATPAPSASRLPPRADAPPATAPASAPPAAPDNADFDDPLAAPSLPPPRPATALPTPSPTAPSASADPIEAAPAAQPSPVLPIPAPPIPAAPPPSTVTPPSGPAQLAPRAAPPVAAAPAPVARATPPRPAAGKPVETIDDEDLPPDLLRNGRPDDDPSYNDEDMVE